MPLIVYKSSAGSGKTTTLVTAYLKLCFKNPEGFKHILAITFTNKAAKEMKARILETLKTISADKWKKDQRIEDLFHATGLSENGFTQTARQILSLIIHRFDDFSVSTIDAFVHKIIRTFANEVNLPPAFEVVIKDEDFVPAIIQKVYDKVGKDPVLTDILTRFVLDQYANEKSADPTQMIGSFITSQFGEDHFLEIKKLEHLTTTQLWLAIKKIFNDYYQLQQEVEKIATLTLELIGQHGIGESDLAGGKNGIYNFFKKAANAKIKKAEDLPPTASVIKNTAEDKWTASKVKEDVKRAIQELKVQLINNYELLLNLLEQYFRAYLYTRKIYTLALVHEVRQLLTSHTDETGQVHISEFNKLVYNQVADQPVPYIYERLGKKYQHFLIDEFQDTSMLQWNNLLPLIDESLSYGKFNMLVGDAKQAIYRFRNGEVELFASLPHLYNNDGSPLALQRENQLLSAYKKIDLDKNWRSYSEIINFNNKFFGYYKNNAHDFLRHIYEGHEQVFPKESKTGGYIQIDLVKGNNLDELSQNKQVKIKQIIDQLLENGFHPGDIAILCRAKKDVRAYAAFLSNEGFSVLSEESLLVANSPEVQAISSFFNLVENPRNNIAQVAFAECIRDTRYPNTTNEEFYQKILSKNHNHISSIISLFTDEKLEIPAELMPLTEIADFVLRNILQVQKANVFVQYYHDFLFQAPQSIAELNQLWDTKKTSLFISTPENNKSIQAMTIHKSKGLDFEIVIVDADKESIRNTKKEFWLKNESPEQNELPVLLLPLTKNLSLIGEENNFEREKTRSELDYMNTLYVAFTRPVQGLFVLTEQKGEKPGLLAKNINGFFEQEYPELTGNEQVSLGSFPTPKPIKKEETSPETLKNWFSNSWQSHIRLAKPDDFLNPTSSERSEKEYGTLIHELLAQINQVNDINLVVEKSLASGLIFKEESEKLKKLFNRVVSHPLLSAYYETGIWNKNETEIIDENGKINRLDRIVFTNDKYVIIDYKTGEVQAKHHEQIENYKTAVAALGIKKAEALLVYLNKNIEVIGV